VGEASSAFNLLELFGTYAGYVALHAMVMKGILTLPRLPSTRQAQAAFCQAQSAEKRLEGAFRPVPG
jgi:hypothetical protein